MARHGRSYQNVGIGVFPPAGGVAAGVTYNDSCTGTITLSGTRVEGKVGTDARSGQITLSGIRTESNSRSESPSGTIYLTGTRVEVFSGAFRDSPTGTVFLTGTRVESFSGAATYSDSPVGIIRLSREETEVCEVLYPSLGTFPSLATYPVEPCQEEDALLSWLRVREKPSLNQSVMVTTPTGKVYRWGEDDPVPEKTFHSLTYGSGMPGGFDQMTATLPRKSGVDYSDLELFSNIQIYSAGGEVTGEYRLDSAPVTAGNDFIITPNAVGWQASLEDEKNAAMVYVDIDMSHWGPPSAQYRLNSSAWVFQDAQVMPDFTTGKPSVGTLSTPNGGAAKSWSAAVYDAGAWVDVGSVYYAWTRHPGDNNLGPEVQWDVQADSVDTFTSPDSTGDLDAAGPGTGTLTSVGVGNRFALAEYWTDTALGVGVAVDVEQGVFWTMLAVYGHHTLTKRGSASATTAQGFWASDIIQHAVETWATQLSIGTIDATSFVIPQLEFRTPTTVAEIIKGANRFHLYDWFIGPGKRFHYRERGTYGRHWLARVGPGKLEASGQTAERAINKVMVSYQDPDGTPRYVSPVVVQGDVEDASLEITDPQHPAVAAGIDRWAILDMGGVSTSAAAIQVGARFLEEINAFDHSGRAELTGHVMNDAGVLFPYSSVQAGDTITFVDAADTSERRIVKATKGANSVSIDLDAPPEGTQALLERLGVQWTNLSALGAPSPHVGFPSLDRVMSGNIPITQAISEHYGIKP
jgi:type II secretory pathway pseudopilin PulG